MPGVKGDFEALRKMRVHLEAVGHGAVRREVNAHCASIASMEIMLGFARGVDPYGKPWKNRIDGHHPLVGFNRYVTTTPTATGFRVDARHKGAGVHQYGATIKAKTRRKVQGYLTFRLPDGSWVSKRSVTIPARQYVPEFALPRSWDEQFSAATELLLRYRVAPR